VCAPDCSLLRRSTVLRFPNLVSRSFLCAEPYQVLFLWFPAGVPRLSTGPQLYVGCSRHEVRTGEHAREAGGSGAAQRARERRVQQRQHHRARMLGLPPRHHQRAACHPPSDAKVTVRIGTGATENGPERWRNPRQFAAQVKPSARAPIVGNSVGVANGGSGP
jgi:hypothetical protein